jgi:hypothetical protein
MTKPKPKLEKTCFRCGKAYLNVHPKNKFCNHDCYYAYTHLKERKKINCVICEKDFYSANARQICCSDECSTTRKYILVKRRKEPFLVAKFMDCDYCKSSFLHKGVYHLFCSVNCRNKSSLKRDRDKRKKIVTCPICSLTVVTGSTTKTCGSKECRRIYNLKKNYELLHNNWPRYLNSLCRKRKDPTKQKHFDGSFLMELLKKQDYKCAISGEPLTCIAEMNTDKSKFRRVHQTNVSIDRIIAGEPYTKENVQLVCLAVNIGRSNFQINEYIDWCKKVANYQTHREAQEK